MDEILALANKIGDEGLRDTLITIGIHDIYYKCVRREKDSICTEYYKRLGRKIDKKDDDFYSVLCCCPGNIDKDIKQRIDHLNKYSSLCREYICQDNNKFRDLVNDMIMEYGEVS